VVGLASIARLGIEAVRSSYQSALNVLDGAVMSAFVRAPKAVPKG